MINGADMHWLVIHARLLNKYTIIACVLVVVFVLLFHNHTHVTGSCPSCIKQVTTYDHKAIVVAFFILMLLFHLLITCIIVFSWYQVKLTLWGKMCNGMIEPISKAFWAHTSATERFFLLLLILTAVPTGQGSGKRQHVSCLYSIQL